MNKDELYEEIDDSESFTQRYLGLSFGKFFFLICLIILLGIYVGVLLYGTNSVEVLLGLDDYEHYLHAQVKELKHENADLQREYFELKEISAQ
jgi:type III secretory pathway component EscU